MKVPVLITVAVILTCIPVLCRANAAERLRYCKDKACYECSLKYAKCTTKNQTEPIPQSLYSKITYLKAKFISEMKVGVKLQQKDIQKYSGLHSLILYGDFSSIDADALKVLPDLTWLHLEETPINFLPEALPRDK